MEHTASGIEPCPRTECFDCLTEAYTCLRVGSCPSRRAADVACAIFSGVCGLVHGADRERSPAENDHGTSGELTCISVTLVEKIASNLTSGSLSPAVTLYCVEVLTVLFQDMDLMLQLMHHFQAEDQIISHLAAKSVSACVLYQLHTSSTVSPVWQQKCVQAFFSSTPGPDLDSCLWSLTDILKRLLKGAHQENFGKLLAAFDSSLTALCSKFLPEESKEVPQCVVDLSSSRRWGTTFCLLLDLLEVLTASSVICGAVVCQSQRITYIHCSALLTVISCSSQYFVKKRALLLLKRAVLQTSGEDWALGEALHAGLKYKHFNADMSMLAHSVLTAVATNWLQRVQVESASFFGGSRHVRGEDGQKPDCVMLRAVSLLLLKSMELHIQTARGTAGVDGGTELSGYLQSLWGFLRQCSVPWTEVTHCCCWVSLLFGEQDDDMMEAAKALFSIFLHHRLCSGLDDFSVLKEACAFGCNPHCHFLLLLQSISFDHSILLDFLISTETCFLEYFVRYLKYLRADWQGFAAACGRTSLPERHLSLQRSPTASCGGDVLKVTNKGQDRVEFSSCVQPMGVISPVGAISLAAGFHLVEYDSSDESDPDGMEVSQDAAGASACEKRRCSVLNMKQEMKQYESSDSTGILGEPKSTTERRAEGPSAPVLQSEQTSYPDMSPLSGQVTCDTLARAVLCMSELREVVTRLQTKKLFPYNPSSLLKLLQQLENSS